MRALVDQNSRLVSAQSTPLLMLDSGNGDDHGHLVLSMDLSNVGTGPAQIAWFHITDAQGLSYSGRSLATRLFKLDESLEISSQDVSATLMRSGDQRIVFRWPKPKGSVAAAEWWKLNQVRLNLHASACYCSIFEECKITEFGTSRPRAVPSCDQTTPHS